MEYFRGPRERPLRAENFNAAVKGALIANSIHVSGSVRRTFPISYIEMYNEFNLNPVDLDTFSPQILNFRR